MLGAACDRAKASNVQGGARLNRISAASERLPSRCCSWRQEMAARRSEKPGFQVVVPYRRYLGRDIMKGHGRPFSTRSRRSLQATSTLRNPHSRRSSFGRISLTSSGKLPFVPPPSVGQGVIMAGRTQRNSKWLNGRARINFYREFPDDDNLSRPPFRSLRDRPKRR